MGFFFRIISVFLVSWHATSFAADEPRLVVLLAIDQLRPDRLSPSLPGGLGRLVTEGTVFSQASLDHGVTNTCPGHVAFSTGVNPGRAGIPGNDYIDPGTFVERYCVDDDDPAYSVFGVAENRSPRAIRVPALGDWLVEKSPDSRVIAISAKDRAAITMGGHRANAAYWFNRETGRFTTSRYYMDEIPAWLTAFNGRSFFQDGAGALLPETWVHGEGSVRADDFPGEKTDDGRVSGHALNQGSVPERANRLYYSAYMDQVTIDLVLQALDSEALGQRGVTDLLALSLSSIDTVGHRYGPFSAESEDTLARLDRLLAQLMDALDEKLDGSYVIALSADHGVLPLPEWLDEQGTSNCPLPESRVTVTSLGLRAYLNFYLKLRRPFVNVMRLVAFSDINIYVNEAYALQLGLETGEIVRLVESYLEATDLVAEVWTPEELKTSEDPIARLYNNSFVPGKSGQMYLQVNRDCLIYDKGGTSHISPYDYDRRVPLIFYGQDIPAAVRGEPANSIDIAPTLGHRLNLAVPRVDGRVLDLDPAR